MVYFFIKYGVDVIFVGFDIILGLISCICFLVIRIFSLFVEIFKKGGNLNDVEEDIGEFVLYLVF